APGAVRAGGRDIECLQVRLSPVVAHAVLGACSQLGETVAALEDLWGRDAARTAEQLRAAGSWDERFAIAQAALARRYQAGRAANPDARFASWQLGVSRGQARGERRARPSPTRRDPLWSRIASPIPTPPP